MPNFDAQFWTQRLAQPSIGDMIGYLIYGGSAPRTALEQQRQKDEAEEARKKADDDMRRQVLDAQLEATKFANQQARTAAEAEAKFWNLPENRMFQTSPTGSPITTPGGTAGGGTFSWPGGPGAIARGNPPHLRGPALSVIMPQQGAPRTLSLPSVSVPQTTLPYQQSQSPTRRPTPPGVPPRLSPGMRTLTPEAERLAAQGKVDTSRFRTEREAEALRLKEADAKREHQQKLAVLGVEYGYRGAEAEAKRQAEAEDPEVTAAEKRKKIADAEKAELDVYVELAAQNDPATIAQLVATTLRLPAEMVPQLATLSPKGISDFVAVFGADASRQVAQQALQLSISREKREAAHQKWTEEQTQLEFAATERWRKSQLERGIRDDAVDVKMQEIGLQIRQGQLEVAQQNLERLRREHPESLDFTVTQGTRPDGTPFRTTTLKGKLPGEREVPNREAGIRYLMQKGRLTRAQATARWDVAFGGGR